MEPPSSFLAGNSIMKHVILGAGPAGVIAAETIRKHAPKDDIVIVGDEPEAPYSRMAIPYLLKNAVDSVADANLHRTGQIALLIVVIAILQGAVRTASRALIFNVGRDVETDLRNDLFAHLLGVKA